MKRALVLSGGGAKGAVQLGMLQFLIADQNMWFDAMFGVSTGALTTATLAQAKDRAELLAQVNVVEQQYLAIKSRRDYFLGQFDIAGAIDMMEKGGFLDPAPLASKIQHTINPKLMVESPIHWECGITDLVTGVYVTISNQHENQIHQAVLASCMEPLIMQLPFEWADGGIRNMTPLRAVFDYILAEDAKGPGEEDDWEIWVLMASSFEVQIIEYFNRRNPMQMAGRLVEILLNEIYINDILDALKTNEKVRAGVDGEHVAVQMRFIAPRKEMGDAMTFDMVKIRDDILYGRQLAMTPMNEEQMSSYLLKIRGGQR